MNMYKKKYSQVSGSTHSSPSLHDQVSLGKILNPKLLLVVCESVCVCRRAQTYQGGTLERFVVPEQRSAAGMRPSAVRVCVKSQNYCCPYTVALPFIKLKSYKLIFTNMTMILVLFVFPVQECQKKLEHKLGLDSYLLKPVQRLTKYQLLLKVRLRIAS